MILKYISAVSILSSINPESGKIELTVKGISEKPRDEWILLTAEEKPFISLVWLGTFILMAGFSVSILRHWDRERKKIVLTGENKFAGIQ